MDHVDQGVNGDARGKTPVSLYLVGAVALLWNGFGAFDYLMTRLRNTDYLAAMMPNVSPDETLAYIDSFPLWAQAGWGLGVWGGLFGAILLLARHRLAVPLFGASLIGALLGLGWQIADDSGPAAMTEGAGAVMPFVIIAVALALFVYARAMRAKGVLR